jgi:hypothetical protein
MSEPAKVFEDRQIPGRWCVELSDDNGGREVAVFSGPNARERAVAYAILNLRRGVALGWANRKPSCLLYMNGQLHPSLSSEENSCRGTHRCGRRLALRIADHMLGCRQDRPFGSLKCSYRSNPLSVASPSGIDQSLAHRASGQS